MWLNSEVYYSYDACNSSKRDSKVFPSSLNNNFHGILKLDIDFFLQTREMKELSEISKSKVIISEKLIVLENWVNL